MPRELTIDIHGKYVEDALAEVREFVRRAPKEAEKIVVIHGYNRGTALRDALRTRHAFAPHTSDRTLVL